MGVRCESFAEVQTILAQIPIISADPVARDFRQLWISLPEGSTDSMNIMLNTKHPYTSTAIAQLMTYRLRGDT